MVLVTVTDDLRGKTQGLCGTYDGDQTNDFTTDTGNVVSEPASFVTTWKRSYAGGVGLCNSMMTKPSAKSVQFTLQSVSL